MVAKSVDSVVVVADSVVMAVDSVVVVEGTRRS